MEINSSAQRSSSASLFAGNEDVVSSRNLTKINNANNVTINNQLSSVDASLSEKVSKLKEKILLILEKLKNTSPEKEASKSENLSKTLPEEKATKTFPEKMHSLLVPDNKGKISEDQMQYGIVAYQLYQKNPAIEREFQKEFKNAVLAGSDYPTATSTALSNLISAGHIERWEAEWVNGLSHSAAQLDKNFDTISSTRSESKNTAIAFAERGLAGIVTGAIKVEPRPLFSVDASNNSKGSQPVNGTNNNIPKEVTGSARDGFLWKPISENDGNLVVLLPRNLTGRVSSAAIYSSLPPSSENLIENGRFSGDHQNGGRSHFRFNSSGGNYPNNAFVVANLRDGSQVSFQINNSASRNN